MTFNRKMVLRWMMIFWPSVLTNEIKRVNIILMTYSMLALQTKNAILLPTKQKISNKLKSRNTNCGNIFCYIISLFRYRIIQLFFQGHLEMDARIQSIFSS